MYKCCWIKSPNAEETIFFCRCGFTKCFKNVSWYHIAVFSYDCIILWLSTKGSRQKKRPFYVKKAPMGTRVPKWRLTWLGCEIHSQELWVPWGCKNLGESNFHMENGLQEAQKLPIGINISPGLRGTCQNFFSFTIGVVGGTFLEVTLRLPKRG